VIKHQECRLVQEVAALILLIRLYYMKIKYIDQSHD